MFTVYQVLPNIFWHFFSSPWNGLAAPVLQKRKLRILKGYVAVQGVVIRLHLLFLLTLAHTATLTSWLSQTSLECSCLTAFVLEILSAWNAFPHLTTWPAPLLPDHLLIIAISPWQLYSLSQIYFFHNTFDCLAHHIFHLLILFIYCHLPPLVSLPSSIEAGIFVCFIHCCIPTVLTPIPWMEEIFNK